MPAAVSVPADHNHTPTAAISVLALEANASAGCSARFL